MNTSIPPAPEFATADVARPDPDDVRKKLREAKEARDKTRERVAECKATFDACEAELHRLELEVKDLQNQAWDAFVAWVR